METPVLGSLKEQIEAKVKLRRMYRTFVCQDQHAQDMIQNRIKRLWIDGEDEYMLRDIARLTQSLNKSKERMATALQNVRTINQVIQDMENTADEKTENQLKRKRE
jgi:hypothetical protein